MSVQACFHDIRKDATLNCSNLLDIDGCPDGIAMSSRQILPTDERPDDLLGRPDGNKGPNFSKLESAHNLP
jgi:hypothetical protein